MQSCGDLVFEKCFLKLAFQAQTGVLGKRMSNGG